MVSGAGWQARGVLARTIVLAISVLVLLPAAARAESPAAEAENLIRDGVALRRQQRDVQALPLFQKAYDLVRNPRTAGQLGLCELGVGYWLEAEQHLKEALATPAHPWVSKNQASLEASLKHARDNIGHLTVTGSPAGAQVLVNGHPVGALPLSEPLRIARGPADIELRAQGYVTARRSLTVTGEAATLEIKLEAERVPVAEAPKAPPPVEKAPQPIPEAPEKPPGGETANRGDSDSGVAAPPGRALRWASIASAVLAAVALGGATFETIRWQSGITDFDNHQTNGQVDCQAMAAQHGGPGCAALYDKLSSDKQLAIIGFAAGGALAATSLTLFLVERHSSTGAPDRVAFGCAPALIDPGVACRLSF